VHYHVGTVRGYTIAVYWRYLELSRKYHRDAGLDRRDLDSLVR
jgi:hypothetical protein